MANKKQIDNADPLTKNPGSTDNVQVMAEKTDGVNPTIDAAHNTDSPVVPGNYHEFNGSQAKMYETYSTRAEKIAKFLGNKSPIAS